MECNDNGFPQGTTSLDSQVAGHAFNDSKPRIGLLVQENGHVLKPVEGPVRGKREVNFYIELESNADPVCQELKSFIPQYFGTKKLPWNGEELEYIVLSNATEGMAQPCVMDVKIGRRTWDPEAPLSKKEKELKKYALSKKEFGFCIPGLQIYDSETGKLSRFGKEFGKDLDREKTLEVFRRFLNLKSSGSKAVIEQLASRAKTILSWCQRQRRYILYSSSLLLAYDASTLGGKAPSVRASLTMIDFAHVFPSEGHADTNYIEGVESLTYLLETLLKECDE